MANADDADAFDNDAAYADNLIMMLLMLMLMLVMLLLMISMLFYAADS